MKCMYNTQKHYLLYSIITIAHNLQIDQVPRISCKDITKSEFMKRYIQRREPVIMTGCGKSWKATNWTLESKH